MPDAITGTVRKKIRREQDRECLDHKAKMEELDKALQKADGELHTQSGWFKTAAVVFTIIGTGLVFVSNQIVNKLDNISSSLNVKDVIIMQHTEQIKGIDARTKSIEDRNKYIDEQSGLLGARSVHAPPKE
jgi:hypothetical protein